MKFIVFLMVIAMVFATGESLKCYQSVKGLDDTFKESDLVLKTCEPLKNSCIKISHKFRNGTKIAGRDCFLEPAADKNFTLKLDYYQLGNVASSSVYFCNTDACNGAGSINSILPIILITLIVSIFGSQNLIK